MNKSWGGIKSASLAAPKQLEVNKTRIACDSPCLLMDRGEMCILYRGPSIYASYQVLVHLAGFREEHVQKLTNQKQVLPMVFMFVNGLERNEQSLQSTSIDVSYQVSVHLAKQFQRRWVFEIDQSETRIVCGGHVS